MVQAQKRDCELYNCLQYFVSKWSSNLSFPTSVFSSSPRNVLQVRLEFLLHYYFTAFVSYFIHSEVNNHCNKSRTFTKFHMNITSSETTPSSYFPVSSITLTWRPWKLLRSQRHHSHTNYNEHSHPWEVNSCSLNQESPCLLCNPKVGLFSPFSQETATGPFSQSDIPILLPQILIIQDLFNIILPSSPRSSK